MKNRLFKHWGFKLPLLLGVLMASMVLASGVALATQSSVPPIACGSISNFTGNYYAFPIPNPDLYIDNGRSGYGIVTGLVNQTLTNGLPTLTSLGAAKINNIDWWSGTPIFSRDDKDLSGIPTTGFFPVRGPGNPAPPSGVTLLPTIQQGTIINSNGEACNVAYNGFTAVHWTATLTVTSAAAFTFKIDSDDDAWLFVNNQLVVDDGWIHDFGSGKASGTTVTLQPGTYPIDIFYCDRCTVDGGFSFSADIPTSGGTESFPVLSATPSYFEQF
jgi:fibro-slime domain-containing protein